jgi:hypothetical protein
LDLSVRGFYFEMATQFIICTGVLKPTRPI